MEVSNSRAKQRQTNCERSEGEWDSPDVTSVIVFFWAGRRCGGGGGREGVEAQGIRLTLQKGRRGALISIQRMKRTCACKVPDFPSTILLECLFQDNRISVQEKCRKDCRIPKRTNQIRTRRKIPREGQKWSKAHQKVNYLWLIPQATALNRWSMAKIDSGEHGFLFHWKPHAFCFLT